MKVEINSNMDITIYRRYMWRSSFNQDGSYLNHDILAELYTCIERVCPLIRSLQTLGSKSEISIYAAYAHARSTMEREQRLRCNDFSHFQRGTNVDCLSLSTFVISSAVSGFYSSYHEGSTISGIRSEVETSDASNIPFNWLVTDQVNDAWRRWRQAW
jgi:hypothetical protein